MTPKQLSAWNELIAREEARKNLSAAFNHRVGGADSKAWKDWVKKQAEEQK